MDRLWSISFLMVLSVSALCVDVSRPASGGGALQPWTKEASLGSLVRRPRVPAWLSPQKVAWGQWKLKIFKNYPTNWEVVSLQTKSTCAHLTTKNIFRELTFARPVHRYKSSNHCRCRISCHITPTHNTPNCSNCSNCLAAPIGTMSRPRLIQCSRIPHHVQRRVAVTWHRTRFCGAQLQNELCKPCAVQIVQQCSSNARHAYIC